MISTSEIRHNLSPASIRWPPTAFRLRLRPFVFYNYGSFMSFSRTRFPVDFCQLVIAQVSGLRARTARGLSPSDSPFAAIVRACVRACTRRLSKLESAGLSPRHQPRLTLDKGYSISQPNLARSLCFD